MKTLRENRPNRARGAISALPVGKLNAIFLE
jgi:hypothetical protein